MPVTLIKTNWNAGNLEFQDSSRNVILTFDSANRKVTIPSGSKLDLSGATGTLLFAAGEIVAVDLATDAVETVKIKDLNVTEAKLALASLTGLVAAVVADANVIGGLPVIHRITVASGANADVDVAFTHKTRVIRAWSVLSGAGTTGSTLQVKNVTTAITEAIDLASVSDKVLTDFAEIDNAQHEIAASANLRVTSASTSADFPGAEVYVMGLRVA